MFLVVYSQVFFVPGEDGSEFVFPGGEFAPVPHERLSQFLHQGLRLVNNVGEQRDVDTLHTNLLDVVEL